MLIEVPDGVGPRLDGVYVPASVAAYFLIAARQIHLRERAPASVRQELLATLSALEAAAASWARRTTLEREDAAPLGATEPDSEMSTGRAAILLNRSRRRVQELVRDGALVGRRVGRTWLIDRRSIEVYRDERRAA